MLSLAVFSPLAGAAIVLLARGSDRRTRTIAALAAALPLVLLGVSWVRFDPGTTDRFQQVEELVWMPTIGVAYRLGLDGIGLALAAVTALLFVVAVLHPVDTRGRTRQYLAWFLFLETVSLGLFLALDLLLFYVFFDLSLVAMYFLIAMWGHGDAQRAALRFFLYTFLGSLTLLLGILGLALAADPVTFDITRLALEQPLGADGIRAGLVLLALVLGLAIKTPLVPLHTWLPAAHVEAPAPASAILAGVLLKMGTFGLVRIPLTTMTATTARYALPLAIVAVVSIIYGALVALGQEHLKRRIAYTSINHMGYVVLGIAVAAAAAGVDEEAGRFALTGATVEMVAHALITGALFLITGSFWLRGHEYDIGAYGGLAGRAPALTTATVLASFASLGLPGLAGFVAEFQIFVGTFAVYPVLAAVGLLGVLVTAALFLQLLQRMFLGELPTRWADLADLDATERATLGVLLALVVVIGVAPGWLLRVVDAAARALVAG